MKLTIHRGTHEIGGSCVELRCDSEKSRIVVDVGMPLVTQDGSPFEWRNHKGLGQEQLLEQGILPQVDGLYSHQEPRIAAVLLSHAHQDHYGFVRFMHPDIPLLMSRGTRALVEVSNLFLNTGVNLDQARTFTMWEQLQVGDFTITPYLMDHSAPDAAAFLIQADDQRLFYTGDFRGHGRKQILLRRLLQNPISYVDCLVMEGSMMRRKPGQYRDEKAVEMAIHEIVAQQRACSFVYCSSQNLDRLVSVYRAVKRARKTLVVDLYTAFVLDKLSSIWRTVPNCRRPEIRVVYPYSHARKLAEYDRSLLYKFSKSKINWNDIKANLENMVILSKDNPYFRRMIQELDVGEDTTAVYSMWNGYLGRTGLPQFLGSRGIEMKQIHTSGHAYVEDLKKLARAMKPRSVVPIHTFYPDDFQSAFPNVMQMKEGEEMAVVGSEKKRRDRVLSKAFMQKLRKPGVYWPIVEAVQRDKDLDMQFRGSRDLSNPDRRPANEYLNIYYKGYNILKLHREGKWDIDQAFKENSATGGLGVPNPLSDEQAVGEYLSSLPEIKNEVATHTKESLEREYEQLIIRANNRDARHRTGYVIVDRQYRVCDSAGRADQWDLVAIRLPSKGLRGQKPQGHLSLIEVKYGLNPDIAKIYEQIGKYYEDLCSNIEEICKEMKKVLLQKLELGLIVGTEEQCRKLRELQLMPEIQETEVIVYLVDYNPRSRLIEKAQGAKFKGQLRIQYGGLALWNGSSQRPNLHAATTEPTRL